jgi:hypothetical protein
MLLRPVERPSVLSQPTEAAVPLLRPPSVLSQLQQFMGKKFVFDDEDNPHEVYEMTEAAILFLRPGEQPSVLSQLLQSTNKGRSRLRRGGQPARSVRADRSCDTHS